MSDYTQREGTASLFRNSYKEKPAQPDYRGELCLNGQSFRLAAWIKEGRNGKFLSVSVEPKNSGTAQPKQSRADDFDDEVGF